MEEVVEQAGTKVWERVAPAAFAAKLARENVVSADGQRALVAANIGSEEELLALIASFPSLATEGLLNFPKLTARGGAAESARALGASTVADYIERKAPPVTLGAAPPAADVPFKAAGERIELDAPAKTAALDNESGEVIDTRYCDPWPVRDQNPRGTCVSFAMSACAEPYFAGDGPCPDLAEQYLYWAIKRLPDSWPNDDGTTLDFARRALQQDGICLEDFHPYQHYEVPGDPGHIGVFPPSAAALADAAARRRAPGFYQPGGGASVVLGQLRMGRPVAVTLPVFKDPMSGMNNWGTPLSWSHGVVLDPPPTSVRDGGHAVCITGFVASAAEPSGGYFVLRNSWGPAWGHSLPAAGYYGPAQGYGHISATYVDRFLWECCQM